MIALRHYAITRGVGGPTPRLTITCIQKRSTTPGAIRVDTGTAYTRALALAVPYRHSANSLTRRLDRIQISHTSVQSTFVVRTDQPIHDPAWSVSNLSLEDLVLAYMAPAGGGVTRTLEALG